MTVRWCVPLNKMVPEKPRNDPRMAGAGAPVNALGRQLERWQRYPPGRNRSIRSWSLLEGAWASPSVVKRLSAQDGEALEPILQHVAAEVEAPVGEVDLLEA